MTMTPGQQHALLMWEERLLEKQDEILKAMYLMNPAPDPFDQIQWLDMRLGEEKPGVLIQLAIAGVLARADSEGGVWQVPPASRG